MADLQVDGITNFDGGMDASRPAWSVARNQYVMGNNVWCPPTVNGAMTRPGWEEQIISWRTKADEKAFHGGNFQGSTTYDSGVGRMVIASVDGYIYQFEQTAARSWKAKRLNLADRNSPIRKHAFFCEVPGNKLIIQNGFDAPAYVDRTGFHRLDPAPDKLGVGRAMVYVQNRLFWVDEFEAIVYASDYLDPFGMTEAGFTQIFGFAPGGVERVIALGAQKQLNRDILGGSLLIGTDKNIYSVDVGGDRQEWGLTERGSVFLSLAGQGVVSDKAFATLNTNTFYRSRQTVIDFRQQQFQFAERESVGGLSSPVDTVLATDSDFMLDRCQIVRFKERLLVTTAPYLRRGNPAWRGLLVLAPYPSYEGEEGKPKRWESLWWGVRPLSIFSNVDDEVFVFHDGADEKVHFFRLREDINCDRLAEQSVPICSSIRTRQFGFPDGELNLMVARKTVEQVAAFDNIREATEICVRSRDTFGGAWSQLYETNFSLPPCRSLCLNEYLPLDTSVRRVNLPIPDTCAQATFVRQYEVFWRGFASFHSLLWAYTPLAAPRDMDCGEATELETVPCPADPPWMNTIV